MTQYLVAGGCGFIGHSVSRQLRDAGHEVHVVDTKTNYGVFDESRHLLNIDNRIEKMDGIHIHDVDIRDGTRISDLFSRIDPECLIHLGNIPVASVASDNPAFASEAIIGGTMTLLEASRRSGVRRFVYISSSMVYGHFTNEPIGEEANCLPVEVYGALKLSCERLVRLYSEVHGLAHTIIRPSAVYGPTGNDAFVLTKFLRAALNGQPIRVRGSESRLDFTFVEDAALGIVLAATSEKGCGETFNITRGEARLISEAANWVASRIPGTEIVIEPADALYPRRGSLGIGKARALLGYEPKYSMEEGLDVFFDFESNSLPKS